MAHNEEAKRTASQFVKFVIVGVMNTLVDFIVFQVCNLVFGWLYLAQAMGYLFGVTNSYLLNSGWTFRDSRTRSVREIVSFFIVNTVTLCVSFGVIWLCKNPLGVSDAWVSAWLPSFLSGFIKGDTVCKLISLPITIVLNFVGNRLLVFNKKPNRTEETAENSAEETAK